MEFRLQRIKEIKTLLEHEINKRDKILKKYKRTKNMFGVVSKVSVAITMTIGAGGIIAATTIALLPLAIVLDSIVVVCGISLLVSSKLFYCISNKIDKHKNIKLLAINKLEIINKIFGQDEIITQEEYNLISTHYEQFHILKSELQNTYKNNIP